MDFEETESLNVSIHASVKDATEDKNARIQQIEVSIHASVKDATPCL